jgi:3-oxoadipate enol-lactonase
VRCKAQRRNRPTQGCVSHQEPRPHGRKTIAQKPKDIRVPAPMLHAHNGDHPIAYRDAGTGPAVVFAHAAGFDHSVWDQVIALLPPGRRWIRFDLRGHGGSGAAPAPYSMGALIRDAEVLLDHLKVRDCVFVGSSIGGMIAQGLAVKRLDQIRALVLTNTAIRIGTKDHWTRRAEEMRDMPPAVRHQRAMAQHFSAAFRISPAAAPWEALLHAQRLETALACAAAIAGTDFYTTTSSLRLPCLVIAGAQDAITPADMARDLAKLIPGADLSVIRKSGHLPMIEQPVAFATLLSGFLDRIGHI